MLWEQDGKLMYHYDAETMVIEPWGTNSVRVRAAKMAKPPQEDWALQMEKPQVKVEIRKEGSGMSMINGKLAVRVTDGGKLMMFNQKGELLLEEYWRNRRDLTDPKCSAIEVEAREFRPNTGGDYHVTIRRESVYTNERIYGMGQYQQPYLNLKGADLELAHRNSQASVPFAISSLGYGLLWNNPGVGRAVFGKNITSFEAYGTKVLDYWFTCGDTPAEIEEQYAAVTGTVPMMPEYGLGFWQCKLRYQTQEELLSVAREYKRRGLPLDLIVIDFFHWPKQGEWKFDPVYWPAPDNMVRELKEMGVELMVSIWPTVDKESENFGEMLEKGYLIRTERGVRVGLDFEGATIHCDVTNPEARKFLWNRVKKNYYDKGIRVFWLDEAEPEYTAYDYDNYRCRMGTQAQVGNLYPQLFTRTFYEGLRRAGEEQTVSLVRCAWAGSQRYGALVWSGDIHSDWAALRRQLCAGLNMGIAGIPWWTTDIGGFTGGDPEKEEFRSLLVRWFEWGTFCPVMRLHGDRLPAKEVGGKDGRRYQHSGGPNEVWSFGEDICRILTSYIRLREAMRPYIRKLMEEAHEWGRPVMRPMFYEFPEQECCW